VNRKRSSRPWFFRIKDISDAIEKIQEYTKGITFEEFDKNTMVLDAVIQIFKSLVKQEIILRYPFRLWQKPIDKKERLSL
jgi:hypothetical protein